MKKLFNKLISIIITLVLFIFIFNINIKAINDIYYLPLFETSDIHGYLANTKEEDVLYNLAYISDKVKDVRGYDDYNKKKAILLDGGDIYQGNTLSNLINKGDSISAAFKLMDYDAVTIGNHDFDWYIEETVDADGTMQDYNFNNYQGVNDIPVICSNIYKNSLKFNNINDYIILEKEAYNQLGEKIDVKVGVVGFAGAYASSIMTNKFSGLGYNIDVDYNKLNNIAKDLENNNLCDATILLTHEDGQVVANNIGNSCFDLVLGGHTHLSLSGVTEYNIPYIEPTCNGDGYAYCELEFNNDKSFNKIGNVKTIKNDKSKLIKNNSNSNELDQEIVNLTDVVINELKDILNKNIGYITENTYRYKYINNSGERATTNGNWIASIVKRIGDADLAFVNAGGLRMDVTIPNGSDKRYITYSDIYNIFPFDNLIYVYELSYEDLLLIFKYAMTSSGKTLFSQMVGINCYFVNNNIDALISSDGNIIYDDGKLKDEYKDKKIRLAVNEFIATTNRIDKGMNNPLITFNETDKLISKNIIDSEGAILVLEEEAKENDGKLNVDTKSYFLNYEYKDNKNDEDNKDRYTELENNNLRIVLISIISVSVIIIIAFIILLIILIRIMKKRKNSK